MAGENLMVVEDEGLVVLDLRRRLETLGFRVVAQAASGEEAVAKAWEHVPDLILMDIRLGKGMDGIEATEAIRKKLDLPVIYLTANSDRATLERAKATAPYGYILKPFRDRELQITIEMALYRHKAEKALRESREWFAAMLRGVQEAVIANDSGGAVRYMNAAAERITGWREEEARGRPLAEVMRGEAEFPASWTGAERAGKARESGFPDLENRLLRFRDASTGLEGEVVTLRDVTEIRRLERQLAQKHRLEAIGRLAGGIAHDFNNLLTAITGFAAMVRDDLGPGHRLVPDVQEILNSADRAAALTRQLLTFSRRQPAAPVELDLGELVRGMDRLLGRLIGENVQVVVQGDDPLRRVKADPVQLEQVVLNLALNARDAMPAGGSLLLETRNTRLEPADFPPGEEAVPGDYVLLAVTDTGIGMDTEMQAHAFEPFFTTKKAGEGTGLGLATVYGIVKQSRGFISLQSEPGAGTSVKVYLPAVPAGTAPSG